MIYRVSYPVEHIVHLFMSLLCVCFSVHYDTQDNIFWDVYTMYILNHMMFHCQNMKASLLLY